jgi:hypothetical protein
MYNIIRRGVSCRVFKGVKYKRKQETSSSRKVCLFTTFCIYFLHIRSLVDLEGIWFSYGVFGLRNDTVHHLLTLHFFVWFVEWSELIHHHLIPHS